jgi:Xaa-Pro dipeptidase
MEVVATRADLLAGLSARSAERREWLASDTAARDFAATVLFQPEDVYLLTGYHTPGHYYPMAVVVTADGEAIVVSRAFERGNMARAWIERSVEYFDDETFEDAVIRALAEVGVTGRVRVQSDGWYVSKARVDALIGTAERARLELVWQANVLDWCRLVKNEAELDCMREAARITSATMRRAIDALHPGALDRDVAAEAFDTLIREGSSYVSLPPFIAVDNGLPHGTWDAGHRLEKIAFVEIAATVHRYGAAIQCNVHVGEPDKLVREAIKATEVGLEAAIENLVPGRTGEEVCKAVKEPLEKLNLAGFSKNRAGYAMGVSFPPDWGEGELYSLRIGEHRPLEEGMAFHVVPSVVIPDLSEIGVSATIVVRPGGGEVITDMIPALTVV